MQMTKPVTKPSKQRKMIYQAPKHVRYKLFAAPLSPELRAKYKTRSIPVKSGDTVRIMRGDRKGMEGKVTRVDRKKYRIYIEGLTREKVDGTTIFIPIHPSKVMITQLNLDDKWRRKILERKAKEKIEFKEKKIEKVEEAGEKEITPEKIEEKTVKEKKAKKRRVKKKAAEKKKEETKKNKTGGKKKKRVKKEKKTEKSKKIRKKKSTTRKKTEGEK